MKKYRVFALLSLFLFLLYNCALPIDDEEEEKDVTDDSTYSLPWSGETGKFSINAKEGIHLSDPNEDAGTAYITTPSTTIKNTRWEFGVRLTFNPSANNYARFYLTSSSNNLSESLSGYFIQIGGAKDNVSLYRQNGNQPQLLASGRDLMKGNNAPELYIKVECDNNGYWTFWTRLESEREYTKEKQIKDNQLNHSICCGIYCVYTKTRSDGFTFHHLQISNEVTTTTQPDDNPEEPEIPVTPDLPEDVRGILLFNEVMYDNLTSGVEYVEIYNPTKQDITIPTLYLYKMHSDGTVYSTTPLQQEDTTLPLVIPTKGYLCFTQSIIKAVKQHKVSEKNLVEIEKFPSLNNDGGYLALSSSQKPEKGHTFDTCCFRDEMHDTIKGITTGISLEKKSPNLSSLNANWHSSTNGTGGTPGTKNSE